jgi:hypothetical protein
MKFLQVFLLLCLFQVLPNIYAAEFESIAFVDSVKGEVMIVSSQMAVRAVQNMKVIPGDSIKTGTNSSVGLIFEDDTVVSLGPGSEMEVDEFLFDPAERQLSFVVRMIKGTFSFITGQIAKLAPQKVILETPGATLGVRGTKFVVEVD